MNLTKIKMKAENITIKENVYYYINNNNHNNNNNNVLNRKVSKNSKILDSL